MHDASYISPELSVIRREGQITIMVSGASIATNGTLISQAQRLLATQDEVIAGRLEPQCLEREAQALLEYGAPMGSLYIQSGVLRYTGVNIAIKNGIVSYTTQEHLEMSRFRWINEIQARYNSSAMDLKGNVIDGKKENVQYYVRVYRLEGMITEPEAVRSVIHSLQVAMSTELGTECGLIDGHEEYLVIAVATFIPRLLKEYLHPEIYEILMEDLIYQKIAEKQASRAEIRDVISKNLVRMGYKEEEVGAFLAAPLKHELEEDTFGALEGYTRVYGNTSREENEENVHEDSNIVTEENELNGPGIAAAAAATNVDNHSIGIPKAGIPFNGRSGIIDPDLGTADSYTEFDTITLSTRNTITSRIVAQEHVPPTLEDIDHIIQSAYKDVLLPNEEGNILSMRNYTFPTPQKKINPADQVYELIKDGPIQKPNVLRYWVNTCLLADGIIKHDSQVVIDLSEYPIINDESIDGILFVMKASDAFRISQEFNRPLTSCSHIRIGKWAAKGLWQVETPFLKAGIYTKGYKIYQIRHEEVRSEDPIGQNNPFKTQRDTVSYIGAPQKLKWIPSELRVKDILLINSADGKGNRGIVMMSMQATDYAGREMQDWYIKTASSIAKSIFEKKSAYSPCIKSPVIRCLIEHDILEYSFESRRTANGPDFKNSLGHSTIHRTLFGNNWQLADGVPTQADGGREKGINRGIPIPGSYSFLSVCTELEDKEIVLSKTAGHNIGWGEAYIWRNPTLPHPGVMIRTKIKSHFGENEWWDWLRQEEKEKLKLMGFQHDNKAHFNFGDVIFCSPNAIAAMDGDTDGDAISATNVKECHGLDIDPPLIVASEVEGWIPEEIKNGQIWCDRNRRIEQLAESQSSISDWWSRKMAEISRNPGYYMRMITEEHNKKIMELQAKLTQEKLGEESKKSILDQIKQEVDRYNLKKECINMTITDPKAVEAYGIRKVKSQIMRKKHLIRVILNPALEIISEIETLTDVWRQLEGLCAANHSIYNINGNTIEYNKEILALYKKLRRNRYIYAPIMTEIFKTMQALAKRFTSDPYATYNGEGQIPKDSKVAYRSKRAINIRADNLPINKIPKEAEIEIIGIPTKDLNGLTVWKNGAGETIMPIVQTVNRNILVARMIKFKNGDNEFFGLLKKKGENETVITNAYGQEITIQGTISYLCEAEEAARVATANKTIRFYLYKEAQRLASKYPTNIPEEYKKKFRDLESFYLYVLHAYITHFGPAIAANAHCSSNPLFNYWTYIFQVVNPNTFGYINNKH